MIDISLFSSDQTAIYKKLVDLLSVFEFEKAFKLCKHFNMLPIVSDIDRCIDNLGVQRVSGIATSFPPRFDLKIKALERFRDNGCDPEKIIEKIILPEGYNGKILLVMIMGGVLGKQVCLRSGDMWHREILRNTDNEIKYLGFFESTVCELGGAHVRFEKNNDIVIYGTSNDFGSCDKVYASKLIQQIFKDRNIIILN